MKKRIIYGIGGTGSATVDRLKSIQDEEFNNATIYRVWDIDINATGNLENLDKNTEIYDFSRDNIRKKIRNIKKDKQNNQPLYDKVFDVFPIDDERQINLLPTTEGSGAAKQPIVSRLVGTIYEDDISDIIGSDCELADDGINTKNAYLIFSACGGTSSGLNVQIYIELIRQGFNVFLFFVSPNYFNEIAPDKRDKSIHAANTVATFLRIFYDLENQKIIYADENGLGINSQVYPFIIESEWSTGKMRAEFLYDGKYNSSEEFFYMYNALAISSFFRVNINRSQTFISSYMNYFQHIQENKTFFNMLLLYPVNNTRDKVKELINKQLSASNGKNGEENLQLLLSDKLPEYELLRNAHNVLITLKSKVENIDSGYTIKDIYDILMYAKSYLEDSNTQVRWNSETKTNENFNLGENSGTTHRKAYSWWNTFKDMFFRPKNNKSDSIETDIQNLLNPNQKIAVRELLKYLDEKLSKYKENLNFLKDKSELPFNPINFDSVSTSESDIDLARFFTSDFQIDEIVKKMYTNGFQSNIVIPPSLDNTSGDQGIKTYPYDDIIINGNHYLLNIHTEIADHTLRYLREENINYFRERRKQNILCYPDKRLNGIFPPDDEIFKDFLIWEENTIKSLLICDSEASSARTDIALFALSLVSDSINIEEMPKKILDLNINGENYYIKALINIDSTDEREILGNETPEWYEAAKKFEDKIDETNKDPFDGESSKVNIPELINLSHQQILNHCFDKKNNSCLTDTYEKLEELKHNLPKIENEKIEEVNEMIDDLNIYLTRLAAEYKKRLLESKAKVPKLEVKD